MTDRRSEEPASHAGAIPRDLPDQQASGTIGAPDPWDTDPVAPERPAEGPDPHPRRGREATGKRAGRLARDKAAVDENADGDVLGPAVPGTGSRLPTDPPPRTG